jgi:probable addiction module antidote protein
MNKRKFRTFGEAQLEHYAKHPRELKSFIEVAFDEYLKDSDEKAFLSALAVATKVRGGFGKLAKETGLNREHLYKALSNKGDPKFSMVIDIIRSLGLSLKVA